MDTVFTPQASLIGGLLIGLSAVILLAFVERIMGVTGILGGFIEPKGWSDWSWRAVILLGMISGPIAMELITGAGPEIQVPISKLWLIVGGLIVGVGVTFGGGCTSGHGVCGVARMSARSIVATITFMSTAGITVYVIRHVMGV